MANKISLDEIISEIQLSDNREQIEYYCNAFCQHVGFKHYVLFGSIFTSMVSSPSYIICSPDKTIRNKKRQLETMTKLCINSCTPVITGNIDKQSILYNSLFKVYRMPAAKNLSISFPVHYPLGKLAFLNIYTPTIKQDVEQKVLSTLVVGNQFARAAATSILHLLDCELEEKLANLNLREKECLLLASDGARPQEIARQIDLSCHTVIYHLKRARDKLETKNIQAAISKAMLRGDITIQIGSEKN